MANYPHPLRSSKKASRRRTLWGSQEQSSERDFGMAGAIWPLEIRTRCDLQPQTCAYSSVDIGRPESYVCLQWFSAN